MRSYSTQQGFKRRRLEKKDKIRAKTEKQVGILGTNPFMHLRYVDWSVQTPTIYGQYNYCLNGMYDPNITGVGHQPLGYDQIMALYQHYNVLRADFKITLINEGNYPIWACPILSRTTVTLNGITNVGELAGDEKLIKYVNKTGETGDKVTFKQKVYPPRWLGCKGPMSTDGLWGGVAANPVEALFLQIYFESVDGINNPTVRILIDIDFYAVFREQKIIAQS